MKKAYGDDEEEYELKGFEIKRGDIFYIGKSPCVGSEQWGGRPGIVVSNEENNMHSETVEVVYCTTRFKPMLPTHTTIRSTPYDSTVLCEQVTTVSVERIGNYIGRCSEEEMRGIDRCILVSLGLSKGKEENPNPDYVPPMGNGRDGSDEEIKLRIERDTYRKMYEMAIERLAKMSENAGGGVENGGSV